MDLLDPTAKASLRFRDTTLCLVCLTFIIFFLHPEGFTWTAVMVLGRALSLLLTAIVQAPLFIGQHKWLASSVLLCLLAFLVLHKVRTARRAVPSPSRHHSKKSKKRRGGKSRGVNEAKQGGRSALQKVPGLLVENLFQENRKLNRNSFIVQGKASGDDYEEEGDEGDGGGEDRSVQSLDSDKGSQDRSESRGARDTGSVNSDSSETMGTRLAASERGKSRGGGKGKGTGPSSPVITTNSTTTTASASVSMEPGARVKKGKQQPPVPAPPSNGQLGVGGRGEKKEDVSQPRRTRLETSNEHGDAGGWRLVGAQGAGGKKQQAPMQQAGQSRASTRLHRGYDDHPQLNDGHHYPHGHHAQLPHHLKVGKRGGGFPRSGMGSPDSGSSPVLSPQPSSRAPGPPLRPAHSPGLLPSPPSPYLSMQEPKTPLRPMPFPRYYHVPAPPPTHPHTSHTSPLGTSPSFPSSSSLPPTISPAPGTPIPGKEGGFRLPPPSPYAQPAHIYHDDHHHQQQLHATRPATTTTAPATTNYPTYYYSQQQSSVGSQGLAVGPTTTTSAGGLSWTTTITPPSSAPAVSQPQGAALDGNGGRQQKAQQQPQQAGVGGDRCAGVHTRDTSEERLEMSMVAIANQISTMLEY